MLTPRHLTTALSLWLALVVSPPATATEFVRGDCNADGTAGGRDCDIADPIRLLDFLFRGGSRPPCAEACNANDDGRIDIADAVFQLSFCFLGGREPPAPFPGCGVDPTPSLPCDAFPPCEAAVDCEPQDARGVGPCAAIVGVVWDGSRCAFISGCSCEGEDCDEIYDSIDECEAARAGCAECSPQRAVGVGPCDLVLGVVWNGVACVTLSGCECEGEDCEELYDSFDECEAARASCLRCVGMDARGVGPCDAELGVVWDGRRCVTLSGCECEGEDCDALYESVEECQAAHEACPDPCARMDAVGEGPCDAVLGWVWDGLECVEISGCECVGEDCDEIFASPEECRAVRAQWCPRPCDEMDARGVGDCEAVLGVRWNGSDCEAIVGCECEGIDCDRLLTAEQCEALRRECPQR